MKYLLFILLILASVQAYAQYPPPAAPTDEQLSYDKVMAVSNDTTALYNLGIYYAYGLNVDKSTSRSIDWLKKSANLGCSQAMLQIGIMYEGWDSLKSDFTTAASWLRKAAAKKNYAAMNELGILYLHGNGVPKEIATAVKHFREAAEHNLPEAMNNMGQSYMQGIGVKKDKAAALKWLQQAAANHAPHAERLLGDYYRLPDMGNDCKEAIQWYRKGFEAGDTVTVGLIGAVIIDDKCNYPNTTELGHWMESLAQANIHMAAFYTAAFYATGTGVSLSHAKAMDFLMKDEEILISAGIVQSSTLTNLLAMYYKGMLDDVQKQVLLGWLEQTAEKTNNDSLRADISTLYMSRDPATYEDDVTAMKWAIEAAARGNGIACYNVAYLYAEGLGVAPSDEKAFEWMNKAAMAGNKDAMQELSDLYKQGRGTKKNLQKAEEWKRKALAK